MSRNIRFLITAFFLIIAISFFTLYWIKSKEDTFADEIISEASDSFSSSLDKFLSTVELSVVDLNSEIKVINYDIPLSRQLNEIFSKMISSEKYLVGVALSNSRYSYIIYRDKNSWATTFDDHLADSTSDWSRLNNTLEVVSEWTDIATTFPSKKNFNDIEKKLESSEYLWNVAENPVPGTKNNLSIIFKTADYKGDEIYAGLIYNALDLSRNFASVLRYDKPLVSILTTDENTISPMITTDSSSIETYRKLGLQIDGLIRNWRNGNTQESRSFSFEKFNQVFWTRIIALAPKISVEGFAVTISALDLAETEQRREKIYLYISLFFVAITLIWIFTTVKRSKSNQLIKDESNIFTDEELLRLISKGETEFVEFKSSLRWDYREEKINKILETVILKSISAFTNAKGGILIIGVSDDLEVLGLQNDFNTLKKKNADYFELHLRKLINNQYGIAFSNECLNITFNNLYEKIICLIQIKSSPNPVFLKTKNKQGTEVEKFYVRSGNASQEISSLTEMNEYIQTRFDN